jgi:uncharacterized protein YkwD
MKGMSRKRHTSIRGSALILALCGLLLVPAVSQASCPGSQVQPEPSVVSEAEFNSSILCLLNQQRTSHGLKALRMNSKLGSAAGEHSTSMNLNGYFSHDSPDGSSFENRISATGYMKGARLWQVGENIGWGSFDLGTPQALMSAWMNSPPHRANILTARFREVGIGVDWGSPTSSQPPVAATATTDFGYAKRG